MDQNYGERYYCLASDNICCQILLQTLVNKAAPPYFLYFFFYVSVAKDWFNIFLIFLWNCQFKIPQFYHYEHKNWNILQMLLRMFQFIFYVFVAKFRIVHSSVYAILRICLLPHCEMYSIEITKVKTGFHKRR